MYRNQYFISNKKIDSICELKELTFNKLYIYSHISLNVSEVSNQSTKIMLLGYIIDPQNPHENNDKIVHKLGKKCKTKESLFKELQLLSGRFVLLYKNDLSFIAVNDATAHKQLYYGFLGTDIILTSSPKMFLDFYGNELEISDLKLNFIKLKEYQNNEFEWYGDKCIDDRLLKVLPNHFLDIDNRKVHRTPIYLEELVNEQEIIEYTSNVLEGSIKAILKRFQVIQPLTAGWDSRTLLAASRKYKEKIQYYVFDLYKNNGKNPDIWVPERLSAKLELNFQVIKPEKLNEDFIMLYKREHIFPRMTKVSDVQYHYYYHSNRNIIRVSGIASAIVKSIYGYTNRKIDAKTLSYFTPYLGKSAFVNQEINYWIDDAKKYSKQYGIPLLDLFHWEQKVGNWGALYAFEQDIAIEEFCPHSNKNLLLSILQIEPKKRSAPKCALYKNLIKYIWVETLNEPINPCGLIKYSRKLIKRNNQIKYYKLMIQSNLQSLRTK